MTFVLDARGNRIEIGDRVESLTRVVKGDSIRPERTGLVIDVFPAGIAHRAGIKVELDDESMTEVISAATLWIRLDEN